MPPARDAALDAFDRLRLERVTASGETALAFLARFQSAAASLKPDERIEVEVAYTHKSNIELVKAVLCDPQASTICSLHWECRGEQDVNSVIPLLINNCPELASLWVDFHDPFVFDFVSSVLEHPGNKVKVLEMPEQAGGNFPRFFAALEQSQVSAVVVNDCSEFAPRLYEYLGKDLLVRLEVETGDDEPSEMLLSMANCTRLAELKMLECEFPQPTAFPQSITKLVFDHCEFADGFDWSFLTDSNVRELNLYHLSGVDGNQLGSALAVHLGEKGLDTLCVHSCDFVNETLAAVGAELGRIERLDIGNVNDASVEQIALALQAPNSELRELRLEYNAASSSLVLALRHPNCQLAKLSLLTYEPELGAAARRTESELRNRRALFVLLQGQQLKRKSPCPWRRLPVEMFRLVGKMLL